MQENEENTDRTHILHLEEVEVEERRIAKRSLVGELVMYQLMGHKPADKDASEETYNRQEQLTCDKVKHVEDRHSKERQTSADT